MNLLFIDTETTGLHPAPDGDEALSIAITDYDGQVLLDTLVQPVRHTVWPAAQRVHLIRPEDVLRPEVPTLAELTPRIADIIRGRQLVAYNMAFDAAVIAEAIVLGPPATLLCAQQAYSEYVGDWNEHHGDYRWFKLPDAARAAGHVWRGRNHGALADAFACRDVWAWLKDPAERARLDELERQRWEDQEVMDYLGRVEQRAAEAAQREARRLDLAFRMNFATRLGISFHCPNELVAQASADVFCRALTGHSAAFWNDYGRKLKLTRYGVGTLRPKLPKHLTLGGGLYLLRPAWKPPGLFNAPSPPDALQPVAMWQDKAEPTRLRNVYNLRKLVQGVDYVPVYPDYDYLPGYYSASALKKQFKLREADIARLRPAWLKSTKYLDYLLYPYPPDASTPQPIPQSAVTDR